MKKEQLFTFLPDEPFKVWCDGEVVVIKSMANIPLYSRRLEHGKVRLKARAGKEKKE